MTNPPDRPKIYHITHVDNLRRIVADGGLVCDKEMLKRGGPVQPIGIVDIKRRRVGLEVGCHPGTNVGDYVPFYFCPRSVMLFVIHRANHPELMYRGGQEPIVHLKADLLAVVRWAEADGRRWAFSLSNAGARYSEFRSQLEELDQLDWPSVAASDFRARDVQERKQAEFLLYERFPFDLVERIGVRSPGTRIGTDAAIAAARHRPSIEVHPEWYF